MSKPNCFRPAGWQNGFTLLEVLITLVIVAIGLLGIAKMQLSGIRFTQDGLVRTKAMMYVYDMADRMRANPGAFSVDSKYVEYTSDYTNGETTTMDCSEYECSSTELAAYDYTLWTTDVTAGLHGGAGTITQIGTTPVFTITITWVDPAVTDPDYTRFSMNYRYQRM